MTLLGLVTVLTAVAVFAVGWWDEVEGRDPNDRIRRLGAALRGDRTDRELQAMLAAEAEAAALQRRDAAIRETRRLVAGQGVVVSAELRCGVVADRLALVVPGVGVLLLRLFDPAGAEGVRGRSDVLLTHLAWHASLGWVVDVTTTSGPVRVLGWLLEVDHDDQALAPPVGALGDP